MKRLTALLAVALLAACGDEPPQPRVDSQPAASGGTAAAASSQTPANIGKPASAEEKKDGANPQQQQVDPKQAEQRRDFRHPNEKAGPTSPETQPKSGG